MSECLSKEMSLVIHDNGPAQELCLFSHNSLRDTWDVSLRVSYGVRLHQNSCRIGMSRHNPCGRILILGVCCGMKNFLPKLILSWSCNLVKSGGQFIQHTKPHPRGLE